VPQAHAQTLHCGSQHSAAYYYLPGAPSCRMVTGTNAICTRPRSQARLPPCDLRGERRQPRSCRSLGSGSPVLARATLTSSTLLRLLALPLAP